MTEDGQAQAEAWFAELAEQAPEERARRLAEAPAEIAGEVARLLRCHDAAGAGFLEPAPPQQIGPYRPIAELGRGGMGVVYLALRTSPPLERPVALKLLPRLTGAASAEARALARLEHPHIARFLDAGTAEDGRSYLAMQYIAGIPIDAYCEEQRLDTRERVRLFLKVCAAVSYAHQQLVLLCDLKPAHILVDAAGEPQLLDFGIARLLDAGAAGGGQAAAYLTPGYASPEQARGEALTTASDVFALGAILQRVVAGAGGADLSAIAAKAQAEEAAARYSSVDALGQDLRRWLQHRPALAQPGSWQHRTRLLLRRQRTPVLIGSAIVAVLVGGLAGTLGEMRRAQREAHLAQQRGAALQQMAAADLLQLDSAIANLAGGTLARERMVDDSLARLEQLAAEPGASAMTRYDVALGYLKLAQLQGAPYQPNLGHTQQALASAQRAAQTLGQLQAEQPGNAAIAEREATAGILAGEIETRLGQYAAAEGGLRRVLGAAEARLQQQPGNAAARGQVAAAALALGDPLLYQQHLRQADRAYELALRLYQKQLAQEPADVNALYEVSTAEHRRAGLERDEALMLQQRYGQAAAAAPLFRRSVRDYRAAADLSMVALEAAPGSEEYQRWNASLEGDLAMALASVGNDRAAVAAASKGITASAALAAADPANLEAQFELAVAYGARAQTELARRPVAAHADLREAEALGQKLYRIDAADVENITRLRGMLEIDFLHLPAGAERIRLARRALALTVELERLDPHRPQALMDLASSQRDLAAAWLEAGDAGAARRLLRAARNNLARLWHSHLLLEPGLWLAAARIEAAPPAARPERTIAARYLEHAAQFGHSANAEEWAAVSAARWELGDIAGAVSAAGQGLTELPDPVRLGAAAIERGLQRAWGAPAQPPLAGAALPPVGLWLGFTPRQRTPALAHIDWRGAWRGCATPPAWRSAALGPVAQPGRGRAALSPGGGPPLREFRGLLVPTLPAVQTARPPRGVSELPRAVQ